MLRNSVTLLLMLLAGMPPLITIGHSSDSVATEMLAAHNRVRARVGVPSLQWSDDLAAHARKWAAALIEKKLLIHNPDTAYGENLFLTDMGFTPEMVVAEWASESRHYSYRSNSCSADCTHYTQIVWRETQRVGCAVASDGGWDVWVCYYDPPGNYAGERPY